MTDNNYNYANPTLAAGGSPTEHLILNGSLPNNEEGSHTPRLLAEDMLASDSTETYVRSLDYDEDDVAIWEQLQAYGRIYFTKEGLFRFEFLPGWKEEAKRVKKDYIIGELEVRNFREEESPSHRITIQLPREASDRMAELYSVDLQNAKALAESARDISPEINAVDNVMDKETTASLMLRPIDEFLRHRQASEDADLFVAKEANYVKFYFGGDLTGSDVGFYIDRSDRIRATYDSFMLYRSKALVEDLLAEASEEEYAVGYFPKTKAIQFVLSAELHQRLLEKYISLTNLAKRWNNTQLHADDFDPAKVGMFESVINVESFELMDSVDLLSFTGEKSEEGKFSEDDVEEV